MEEGDLEDRNAEKMRRRESLYVQYSRGRLRDLGALRVG
jgi:hypothetical protein